MHPWCSRGFQPVGSERSGVEGRDGLGDVMTALVVPVPEAEPLVGSFREKHDQFGRLGVKLQGAPAFSQFAALEVEGVGIESEHGIHPSSRSRRLDRYVTLICLFPCHREE